MEQEPAVSNVETPAACAEILLTVLPSLFGLLRTALPQDSTGLTPAQYRALYYLQHGDWTSRSLAQRLEVRPASLTNAIDVLVQRDLAERVPCSHDRRTHWLRATPRGIELWQAARHCVLQRLAQTLARLSDEERFHLAASMKGLARILEDHDDQAANR